MKTIRKTKNTGLYPDFGVIIEGLDINNMNKDETVDLRTKLQEHQLLLVKAKTMRPKEQVEFSKVFGALEKFPYSPTQFKEYPEIFRLSTDTEKGYENVGFYWHQDGSFNTTPTSISIFHLTEIPRTGGATLFANAYRLYDLLPEAMKTIAENLKTEDRGGAVHDVVITHPITGKKAIYLNFGLTRQIYSTNETKQEDIKAALDKISRIINLPDVMYTHHWKEGDIVIIDNYAVFHKATAVKDGSTRTLHRTTIKGHHTLNR
ncbi:MAG: TauD/TfdA family dioxygenase [Saonia sp.]